MSPTELTGKQLPNSTHNNSNMVGSLQHEATSNSKKRSSWRLRDSAEDLLRNRRKVFECNGNNDDELSPAATMHVSSNFNDDTCLARIRRDKANVVRTAFDAAATAVLEGLRKQDARNTVAEDKIDYNEADLPAAILHIEKLAKLRKTSLQRAHENKEYAKKKGGKTEPASSGTASGQLGATDANSSKSKKSADSSSKDTNKASPASRKTSDGPKFTRNTPASSAAALDFRFNSSRAILCAVGNIAFDALTPPLEGHEIDVLDIPQNPSKKKDSDDTSSTTTGASSSNAVNMGSVVVEAQTLGKRTISVAENAARRASMRYQFRKDNARYNEDDIDKNFLRVENPFAWKNNPLSTEDKDDDEEMQSHEDNGGVTYFPDEAAITSEWSSLCLPRLLSVLKKGSGHAIYHDVEWSTRHGRIADIFRELSSDQNNFGPHLIVTTGPEVVRFAQEFHDLNTYKLVTTNTTRRLRTMVYNGSKRHRSKLRRHFSRANGLPEAPFHVLVTCYASFLEDYLHFCHLPFEVVLLDDGVSWMAAAQGDQNSAIGSIWDSGIWSSSDQQIGLAGTGFKGWDFARDDIPETTVKEAWLGLTARHRVVTSSTFHIKHRQSIDTVPISGLVNFVAPHFAYLVREEWDRSRIASDAASMEHFQQLVARSIIVHCPDSPEKDMFNLALEALNGRFASPDRSDDPEVPEVFSDDTIIAKGMVAFSRRSSLPWLGPPKQSWLRYELGNANLQNILDAMKLSNNHGHICAEITTASSMTSSGATGQVTGTMAYRLAVRCGRHFGSEQGLRQHVSALHAPAGTWLCRTCGTDCGTSQARTHHERSCGQPTGAGGDQGGSVGATPTVGQGAAKKGGTNKKKGRRAGASQKDGTAKEEKDADGSFRVPGYRGVWVNKAGKHFVKIGIDRLTGTDDEDDDLYFDNIDDAARKYDKVVKKRKDKNQKIELNFKADGSRIVYEDIKPASTSGVGGSASNVVPSLSVINIKDLPPDVKPLLRDPRQTSRTGGNSKRHIYAYRGVCRQSRKGHDRWQSQISFMGVNHYLGTFDSEWDAAAIYAWAHLILYGEEATAQAQKEGEEAAAAYEKEKRDIAAGILPAPPPKPEKKKKKPNKKAEGHSGNKSEPKKKRKAVSKDNSGNEKKTKSGQRISKVDKESIGLALAKGVIKAPILAPRDGFEGISNAELARLVSQKLVAARNSGYCVSVKYSLPAPLEGIFRPCIPVSKNSASMPAGGAMLLGLSPASFGWDLQDFVARNTSEEDTMTAIQMLAVEYDEDGTNENFASIIQGTVCLIGNANKTTRRMYGSLLGGSIPIGGAVGKLDCHIGGVTGSCGESAAYIRYAPTTESEFQFASVSDEDIVTLNGQRITPEMGCFPLLNEDICSVGARVFVFMLPNDK